jgi:hypothetical protein
MRAHFQRAALVGMVFFAPVDSGSVGVDATVPAQVSVGANAGNGIRAAETKSRSTITSDEATGETTFAHSAAPENSLARVVHGRPLHESWTTSVLGK